MYRAALHIRKSLPLALTALLLLLTLFMSACRAPFSLDTDPFVNAETDGLSGGDLLPQASTGYDPDAEHGELKLYRRSFAAMRVGEMGVRDDDKLLSSYPLDSIHDKTVLCFDPLCKHDESTCAAYIDYYLPVFGAESLPSGKVSFVDLYDDINSPTIYLTYRRSEYYVVGGETLRRDPLYCIERFDLSKGVRTVVLDRIDQTVADLCSYGDYLYYVTELGVDGDGDELGQTLYRVHKSGGIPERLDALDLPSTLSVMGVHGDQLYCLVQSRYLYRCALDLSGFEMVYDFGDLQGENSSNAIVQGLYCGYIYYTADYETVEEEGSQAQKYNLYRIPADDLTSVPQRVAENIYFHCFAETTAYYEPFVFKYVPAERGEEEHPTTPQPYTSDPINECDGTLIALDLETGESKTLFEKIGINIHISSAYDDRVYFNGMPYCLAGKSYDGPYVAYTG